MSQTLGEKLRLAREAKGLSLSEVAEQTRISSLYLESIENDDYKILPGGIFNKGFVKSYAKFVGINEQEALMDYQAVLARNEGMAASDEPKVYRPEVLTDDNSRGMLPTIIVAGIVLAIMTVGILYLVNYIRSPEEPAANASRPVTNSSPETAANSTSSQGPIGSPAMGTSKIDFTASGEAISLTAVVDGKESVQTVAKDATVSFTPTQSLMLRYSRSLSKAAKLAIDGKPIELPSAPQDAKRPVIEVEITSQNLADIWQRASFVTSAPTAPSPNSNTPSAPASAPRPSPSSTPRPSPPANTASSTPRPSANTARPPVMSGNRATPRPQD